jgi:hypothetical protein
MPSYRQEPPPRRPENGTPPADRMRAALPGDLDRAKQAFLALGAADQQAFLRWLAARTEITPRPPDAGR